MAQTAVKVLFSQSHYTLNDELVGWLKQSANQITIRGISMDSNQYGHCLTVMYTTGGGPAYGGLVLFSRRHDDLEAEANETLAQAQHMAFEFVAVGSNEHGHCLCVIGQA
ncbi:MAG TPA: hypothetical protein VK464_24555 [Symbiobacteriaceae bacterium]|nr:hypothetical protein [Symbiobacteriaceae bacterium]